MYMYMCICICICICVYVCMCVCVYVCMCVCVYIYIYICIYTELFFGFRALVAPSRNRRPAGSRRQPGGPGRVPKRGRAPRRPPTQRQLTLFSTRIARNTAFHTGSAQFRSPLPADAGMAPGGFPREDARRAGRPHRAIPMRGGGSPSKTPASSQHSECWLLALLFARKPSVPWRLLFPTGLCPN